MNKVPLGNKLIVSRVGQGLSSISENLISNREEFDERVETIQYGISEGLTLLDTSENYGSGVSETLIGSAVRKIRDKVQIASKFSPENSDYKSIILAAENSLKRLRTEYIDLYQIHWPNENVPFEETFSALTKLVDDGKIVSIGVCNFSKRQLVEVSKFLNEGTIVSNQVEYNLYERYIEKNLLPFCSASNIKIIAYSPLDKGRVVSNSFERSKLHLIADKYGKTEEQIALAWILQNSNTLVISRTKSRKHLLENSQSLDFSIDEGDYNTISQFKANEVLVIPSEISVSQFGEENRKVYQTLTEAKLNHLGLCPSPEDLSKILKLDSDIKPVRLIPNFSQNKRHNYDLIEGRLRYWAWVIAFGFDNPIPSYIRESKSSGGV